MKSIFNKKTKNICYLLVIILFQETTAFAQTEDASQGKYAMNIAKRTLTKYDKNKDGKLQKAEDEKIWLQYKQLDTNKDQALSLQELVKSVNGYLTTPNKKIINVLYKTIGRKDLYLDIYYPAKSNASEKLPVVFYTHGGGWAAGSRHGITKGSFTAVAQQLLAKGFCVIPISYRLVKKGGDSYMRDCVIDAKDAMRYMAKHAAKYNVNAKRFFSFGDSAGGHISQMLLLSSSQELQGDEGLANYSYTMQAGVSWYGPCDFEKMSLFNHDDRPNFRDRFGARIVPKEVQGEEKRSRYREMSPINYVSVQSPPLLMIQGNKDTTIPVKHAYYMQEKLKSIHAPVEIMIVENAGHNWRRVEKDISPTREEIIQKTVDFFVSHK